MRMASLLTGSFSGRQRGKPRDKPDSTQEIPSGSSSELSIEGKPTAGVTQW